MEQEKIIEELADIQRPEEHSVAFGLQFPRELRQLAWLVLFVMDLGPEWTTAEQPHRHAGQRLCVRLGELDRVFHPRTGVHGAPEDRCLDTIEVVDVADPYRGRVVSQLTQTFGDRLAMPSVEPCLLAHATITRIRRLLQRSFSIAPSLPRSHAVDEGQGPSMIGPSANTTVPGDTSNARLRT
jgi:hypothetical protein